MFSSPWTRDLCFPSFLPKVLFLAILFKRILMFRKREGLVISFHRSLLWESSILNTQSSNQLQSFFFFNVYFSFWEREHERGMDRERGRHRIRSQLQAPSCQHRARCGAQTHVPQDHDLSWSRTINQLSYPGAPNVYLFLRERESVSREGQREGDTESEAGSRLQAVSTEPDAGLELTNRRIMTWAEVGRSTD